MEKPGSTIALIGQTSQRGEKWIGAQSAVNAESFYPNGIPVDDVKSKLFGWEALSAPLTATLPGTPGNLEAYARGEEVHRIEPVPGPTIMVPGKKAIIRSDNHHVLGVHGDTYQPHPYSEWLIDKVGVLLGDDLTISAAYTTRFGARAAVEVSRPNYIHDDETGIEYRPNMLAVTSFDGSLSSTYVNHVLMLICNNMESSTLGAAGSQKVRVKHTSRSAGRLDVNESRRQLAILNIDAVAETFIKQATALTRATVTDADITKFLDIWAPRPEEAGAGQTRADNKRDAFNTLYRTDSRVTPWTGTAFGVVQAVNTYTNHVVEVRGGDRDGRNIERGMTGKIDQVDGDTVATLRRVLQPA